MHWYYILKLFGVYCFGSWVLLITLRYLYMLAKGDVEML